jgi:hypothetical protein
MPNITYAKDGGNQEWVFDAGRIDAILGDGTGGVAAIAA